MKGAFPHYLQVSHSQKIEHKEAVHKSSSVCNGKKPFKYYIKTEFSECPGKL